MDNGLPQEQDRQRTGKDPYPGGQQAPGAKACRDTEGGRLLGYCCRGRGGGPPRAHGDQDPISLSAIYRCRGSTATGSAMPSRRIGSFPYPRDPPHFNVRAETHRGGAQQPAPTTTLQSLTARACSCPWSAPSLRMGTHRRQGTGLRPLR